MLANVWPWSRSRNILRSAGSVSPTSDNRRMVVLIRQLVWIILSLFTLSFWMNVSMLIEWSSLADNIGVEVNRCDQQLNFCRYRYPLLLDPTDRSADGLLDGPDWNTTAVGDDSDSSVSRILIVDCFGITNSNNS